MPTFIYHPRSGDRVFAWADHPEIGVINWDNGCRHVVGGAHLSVVAVHPGKWWRDQATTVAAALVQAAGGIAWDDQGKVSLILPERWAVRAVQLLIAAGGDHLSPEERDRLTVSALMAGHRLDENLRLTPSMWEESFVRWSYRTVSMPAWGDEPARTRVDGWRQGESVRWTVPADWSSADLPEPGIAPPTASAPIPDCALVE